MLMTAAALFAVALCTLADDPIVIPPAGVVIPPARPGDPPIHLTVPFNPNAASKADLSALEKRVDDLIVKVESIASSAASLARTPTQAVAPPAHGCASGCLCTHPGACGTPGCECMVAARPKQAITTTTDPPSPKLYQLTDVTGRRWTHADPAWLRRYVGQVNARLAPQRYASPLYPYGAGCAGGRCGR